MTSKMKTTSNLKITSKNEDDLKNEDNLKNTSLAAPGALAHRLQRRTACQWASKWLDDGEKKKKKRKRKEWRF